MKRENSLNGLHGAVSSSSNPTTPNSKKSSQQKIRQRLRAERRSLVLWRHPITTLEYFFRESLTLLFEYRSKLLQYKRTLIVCLILCSSLYVAANRDGAHRPLVQNIQRTILWCSYWIGLGILSSVGLGTGLHTFLLYLGPHIAKVTLAAYECGTLDFPQPPYPDEIVCPTTVPQNAAAISIWAIMAKVRLEAMCWGAGTALGELPPYFMARAARLSGGSSRKGATSSGACALSSDDSNVEGEEDDEEMKQLSDRGATREEDDDDDEEDESDATLRQLEKLQRKQEAHVQLTWIERGQLFMEQLVERVGFLGILACASVPNPLFDLAGITCGHFLVPFWTFFGATLIGKAFIKMHIQKLFVIIASSELLMLGALDWLKKVPWAGARLEAPFKTFLDGQKSRFRQQTGTAAASTRSSNLLLANIFEKFVLAMVLYFLVSIVNSFAQSYHKRLCRGPDSNGGSALSKAQIRKKKAHTK